jgi:hypothetical protein
VALAALPGAGGCLRCLHPVGPPTPEQAAPSACLPACCRNHVHVYFIHGMDPLDAANLAGVRDYVQGLGYLKTHYGQLYHTCSFRDDLRRVHDEDPDARFALVGFSFGANMVRNVCQAVKDDGITVDLLVYLGGNTLKDCPSDKPDNALHIVNILATGCIWNGDHLEGADNMHYTDVWHFGSPSHLHTLDVLAEELAVVAARVPVVVKAPPGPAVPLDEPPTPRPSHPMPPAPRDEWDFLKPDDVEGKPAAAPEREAPAKDAKGATVAKHPAPD